MTIKDRIVEIIGQRRYGLYDWERIKAMIHPTVSLEEDAQWVFQAAGEVVELMEGERQQVIREMIGEIEGIYPLPQEFKDKWLKSKS